MPYWISLSRNCDRYGPVTLPRSLPRNSVCGVTAPSCRGPSNASMPDSSRAASATTGLSAKSPNGTSRHSAIQYSSIISAELRALSMRGAGGMVSACGSGPCRSKASPACGFTNRRGFLLPTGMRSKSALSLVDSARNMVLNASGSTSPNLLCGRPLPKLARYG